MLTLGCATVKGNVGAINLAKNPAIIPNCKHIDVRYPFLREGMTKGEFKAIDVQSDQQHAVFLKKPLAREAFCAHRNFVANL